MKFRLHKETLRSLAMEDLARVHGGDEMNVQSTSLAIRCPQQKAYAAEMITVGCPTVDPVWSEHQCN